jgi:hypothetical protein
MNHLIHSPSSPRSGTNAASVPGRKAGLLGLLALICCLASAPRNCAAEPVLLRDPAFMAAQRPGVPFDHDRHSENLDCTLCHHAFENGQNVWEPDMEARCSACHGADDNGRLGLRQAWHRQCIGCHEKETAAPVMCGECHVRGDGGKP